ncbi:PDZ domain-containing protein [Methylorubrum sp. GM97]|uniref:PDZ domain-containing protein n=1 Tax=Methylorubrum sp. GM97 TaxID=2938232 RepID=UPI00218A7919|nr:PDZ domain-containing protein [Methylorubrum sp. GM97]BDL38615.1 hypothetical protein MSPGM_12050 [Methylorubrum sp. GM97]
MVFARGGSTRLIDLATGAEAARFDAIHCFAFAPVSNQLAICRDKAVEIWDRAAGKSLGGQNFDSGIKQTDYHKSADKLLIATADGSVFVAKVGEAASSRVAKLRMVPPWIGFGADPVLVRLPLGPDAARAAAQTRNGVRKERRPLAIQGTARLGVAISPVAANESSSGGILLREVQPDGAGFQAGLRVGDIIERFDGQAVRTNDELRVAVVRRSGDTAVLSVVREGKRLKLTVFFDS